MANDVENVTNCLPTQLITLRIPGGEYTLTPFRRTDVPRLQSILSQDIVNDRLIAVPKPYTTADAEWWVNTQLTLAEALLPLTSTQARNHALFAQDFGMPVQVIRHNGTLIGCCTLTPLRDEGGDKVELGYYLDPAYQRKGITRSAASAVVRLAAKEWGVRRVHSSADWENAGSQKVLGGLVREEGMVGVVVGKKGMVWPAGKYGDEEFERWSETWDWEVR